MFSVAMLVEPPRQFDGAAVRVWVVRRAVVRVVEELGRWVAVSAGAAAASRSVVVVVFLVEGCYCVFGVGARVVGVGAGSGSLLFVWEFDVRVQIEANAAVGAGASRSNRFRTYQTICVNHQCQRAIHNFQKDGIIF
jgi:hypothetical protein